MLRLVLASLLFASPALAQQTQEPNRPAEDELFGAPPASPAPAEAAPPAEPPKAEGTDARTPPASDQGRDAELLGDPGAATRFSQETAPEDPLRIGGFFYLRTQATGLQEQGPDEWSFSAPSLLDVYLDARPNERVRGYVLGRMLYDPTLPEQASGNMTDVGTVPDSGGVNGSAPLSTLLGSQTRGPRAVLDQFWLRFDVHRRVFVTAGKQHVRWGTARFWTPTDFLHIRRRNPLDVFDARTGTTMLKLHVPWEERGWNFYAYALPEAPDATRAVGDVAGAARAEIVLGTTEAGAGVLLRQNDKPKIAADVSTGLWEFDLYGEVALRYGSEIDRLGFTPDVTLEQLAAAPDRDQALNLVFPRTVSTGLKPQTVGGLSWTHKYSDTDTFTLGAEYFYNPLGYDDTRVYPGLLLRGARLNEPATFFYLGRQYGGLYFVLPAPGSWNLTTFVLSTLANLSDRSAITRLDYSLTLLTHLRFEAFVSMRYGRRTGEFRFGIDDIVPGIPFRREPALVDLGLALRMAI